MLEGRYTLPYIQGLALGVASFVYYYFQSMVVFDFEKSQILNNDLVNVLTTFFPYNSCAQNNSIFVFFESFFLHVHTY